MRPSLNIMMEPCALIIAETILLSHEARLDKAPRTPFQEPLFVNLIQGSVILSSNLTLPVSLEVQL